MRSKKSSKVRAHERTKVFASVAKDWERFAAWSGPKFPQARVKLVGEDGNAIFILARVSRALKDAGATPEQLDEFHKDAKSSDYDHLLRVCMQWAKCD